eukprot:2000835-Rhodomonas_salina.1
MCLPARAPEVEHEAPASSHLIWSRRSEPSDFKMQRHVSVPARLSLGVVFGVESGASHAAPVSAGSLQGRV